jgi:hypothetical protein
MMVSCAGIARGVFSIGCTACSLGLTTRGKTKYAAI